MKRKAVFILLTISVFIVALGLFFFYRLTSPSNDVQAFEKDRPIQHIGESEDGIKVAFFGVSTLSISDGETTLLIDGFFSRPSTTDVLTGKLESNIAEVKAGLKEIHALETMAVFVAHSHYDHALDVASVSQITGAHIYGTESTLNIARGGDIPEERLKLVGDADVREVGRFTVTTIKSKHSTPPNATTDQEANVIPAPLSQPATNEDYAMGGNLDFLIEHPDGTILVKASANYVKGALNGIETDLLLLGSAQLGMQSEEFQSTYLVESINSVNPKVVVPLHWDNFVKPWVKGQLEFNPRAVDSEPAKGLNLIREAALEHGAEFKLLQGGDSIVVSASARE